MFRRPPLAVGRRNPSPHFGQATLAAFALAAVLTSVDARGESTMEVCAASSERAQDLRSAGQLRAAREKLLYCARGSCPRVVRVDCEQVLGEVDQAMPTVIVKMMGKSGRDLAPTAVFVDGALTDAARDGRAIALDPGRHVVRAEAIEGSGPVTLEALLITREGEKDRLVVLDRPDEPATATRTTPLPIAGFIFLGVGVAGTAAFAALAITGQNEVNRCERRGCTADDVDALKAHRVAAFASLGAGALALAGAAYFLVLRPRITLSRTGAAIGVEADF